MLVNVAGVVGKVCWDSFRKGRNDTGPFVIMQYIVDSYANADLFIDGAMGGVVTSGGTVRNVPKQKCPTNPTLYALSAESDYAGERDDVGGVITFQAARVTVTYGVLSWPQFPADDPGGVQAFPNDAAPGEPYIFAECEIDSAGQMTRIPGGVLKTVTAPVLTVDDATQRWEGLSVWRITRHNYPDLPFAKVVALQNKVNSSTFLGQAAGYVRFASSRTKLVMTANGVRCQQFEMNFEVRTEGTWNQVIRPDTLAYDTVQDSGGKTIYTLADLRPLTA